MSICICHNEHPHKLLTASHCALFFVVMYSSSHVISSVKSSHGADTPLPMQLQELYLSRNQLVGALPGPWSNLSRVS